MKWIVDLAVLLGSAGAAAVAAFAIRRLDLFIFGGGFTKENSIEFTQLYAGEPEPQKIDAASEAPARSDSDIITEDYINMKSMLVIGLDGFGRYLAQSLSDLGAEVMAVDRDEAKVAEASSFVTVARQGDSRDLEFLSSLGVSNFDACFVCAVAGFQYTLEVTELLKELGAKYVVARTDSDRHAKFLESAGADRIICPEKDAAASLAGSCVPDEASSPRITHLPRLALHKRGAVV